MKFAVGQTVIAVVIGFELLTQEHPWWMTAVGAVAVLLSAWNVLDFALTKMRRRRSAPDEPNA